MNVEMAGRRRFAGPDAERALDALSDLLMEGLDAREALEWMRRQGFELAGLDMRVMGVDELMRELAQLRSAAGGGGRTPWLHPLLAIARSGQASP